jgi:hypothetical protein
MTRPSPYVIGLSAEERAVLEERARAYTAPFATVLRAKIVLLAADGPAGHGDRRPGGLPRRCGVPVAQAVLSGGPGRAEGPQAFGRPPFFSPSGGRRGQDGGLPAAAALRGAGEPVELPGVGAAAHLPWRGGDDLARTVRRWLAEDVLKRWQHRSWIFP